jgi:hypothetical protein
MAKNDRNPANPESELFVRLTRLFSGPLTNYKSQTPRRLRRHQLDQFNTRFRSASGQQFKRSSYYPFTNMQNALMINHNRTERYVDFDQMEYTPEIASALDIYADEMTTHSALQPMLSIKCPSEEIRSTLFSLYHNVLNINSNLFGWCRTMCKFGDFFLYLDTDEIKGITNGIGLPSNEVERLEGEDKTNPNYVQFQWNSAGMTFENWQVAHFRILGNDKYAPYGTSVLEPARRIWRQLNLLEDAMMAYRIVRAPDRRVFYVDVGSIAPTEIEQYMQRVMTQMKRNSIVDENTGRVDLRYNPLSVEEDYYIPVRGSTSSKIESLPGGTFTGQIEDVKYLRDKLFSALKIPASYLSRAEGAEEDKTTLAQKDIRFARTIQRLQRSVVAELEKIGIIHLYTLGFRGDDLLSFSLSLNNPSKIAELQELEHWSTKFDVAAKATENFFSRRWISERLFNMSEEEFLRNQREIFYDRKFDAQIAGVAERMQESTAASPYGETGQGELASIGGAELGGGELGGGEGETPELGGGAEAGAESPAEEPGALLAAPGGGAETPAGGEEGGAEVEPGAITLQEDEVDEVKVIRITSGGVEERHRGPSGKTYYSKKRPRNTANVRTQKGIATMVKPEAVSYRTERSRNPTQPQFTQLVKGSGLEETIYNQQEAEILRSQIEVKKLLESLEKKTK